jgi:hypothetical protein
VAHDDRVGVEGDKPSDIHLSRSDMHRSPAGTVGRLPNPLTVTQQPAVVINNFHIALYVLPQPLTTTTGDWPITPRALNTLEGEAMY